MSSLYQIIKALQNAQGSNAKFAILQEHKGSGLLKAYLKACYDPAISYYQKVAPKPQCAYDGNLKEVNINSIVHMLSGRAVTGNEAASWLRGEIESYDAESQELIALMISRSIGAGIGDTLILKVFPELWFSVPYQRCGLLDAKAKERFEKLPLMYVQEKCDGSFLYLVKEAGKAPEAITRAGSKYPQWFADKLARGVPDGTVLVGECLVHSPYTSIDLHPLSRQIGNGILNSVLKGGDQGNNQFSLTAWDMLTTDEFKAGKSYAPYAFRLEYMQDKFADYDMASVKMIETFPVKTLGEAYKIYSEHTARGQEGCVLKNPKSLWSNGTSKDMVKMKISFEAEYVVTGTFEGAGKYVGMLGGYNIETSDGLLKSSVGTGFSDAMRKSPPAQVGDIITVVANDVVSRKDGPFKSLFLPVYSEVRFDKTEADSLERVMEQLGAAKGLK